MSTTAYATAAGFSVAPTFLQVSQLPSIKPSGNNLARLQALATALGAVMAADAATRSNPLTPQGGKVYLIINSPGAWQAAGTLLAAVQQQIAGPLTQTPT
jgi:hypothetical protein